MENIGHIKTHKVTIVELATGNETRLDVQSGENMSDGTYVIWCSLNDQEMTSTEDKYFKSFQQFRDKLLEAGYGIKCNGARLNVAPLSKFETGPQVYILESGKKNNPDITVNIWDKADINDFPDSRQQNRYINKWTDEHMGRPEQSRELSKLCLAGFVFAVLPPVLLVLGVLMQELFFVWFACALLSPLLGLIFSIVGLVTAGRKGNRGKGFGIAGIALPVIAFTVIFIILAPILSEMSRTNKMLAQNEMYALGYMGKSLNTEYDVSQYMIPEGYDFNSLNITISDTELEAYCESKLEKIDNKTDKSIRGVFQTYSFLVIRSDKLNVWLESNSPNGFYYHDGYAYICYPTRGMENMIVSEPLAVYKDPSDKFVVITNCNDYKVIAEFFE